MEKTWIGNEIKPPKFSPEIWSVWSRVFWTTNDMEGYHNRMAKFANSKALHFYKFLYILDHELSVVQINMSLLSEKKLKKIRRKDEYEKEEKIQSLSNKYADRELTTHQFLKLIGQIYAPY